ncbi:MAG: DUF1223 domain-containing protein [Xanthobacteraceae bacterium]
MVHRCLAFAVAAVCASTGPFSSAYADPRAVVELFTSQGCSSCPPADKLLGQLAADPALVAITLPVDYWDYLGWKDTLAHPRSAVRQTGYMKTRGDRERYTPQAVVNGSMHALGSSRDAIDKAIAKSRQNPAVLSMPVKLVFDGRQIAVSVPDAGGAGAHVEIWIAGLTKAVTVAIKRGENRNKTVTYYNVVRTWSRLGTLNGQRASWTLPAGSFKRDGVDGAAVILQTVIEQKPGPIVGAAIASVH